MTKKIIDGIGIDFGTYYTKISLIEKGTTNPTLLPKKLNPDIFMVDGIIPSFIFEDIIGNQARKKWQQGENVQSKFKLGLGLKKDNLKIDITKRFLYLLYKKVIKPLKEEFEIKNYRITFPNQWDEKSSEILLKIFKEAGFDISDTNTKLLTPEPYASAIYYTHLLKNTILTDKDTHFLIIDVGAGTTDISLVKYDVIKKELIVDEEKGCRQGFEIAGYHIDEQIGSYLIKKKIDNQSKLLSDIEKAKIQITKGEDSYEISFESRSYNIDKNIIRKACSIFSQELEAHLNKIRDIIEKENIYIDYILTAGGSGELFLVQESIKNVFNREADNSKIRKNKTIKETDDSIPFGAAMEAAQKYTYKDIVNHSICLAVIVGPAIHQFSKGLSYNKIKPIKYAFYGENVFIELIKKGTSIPTDKFYTSKIFYGDNTEFKISSGGMEPKVKIVILKNKIKKEEIGKELSESYILDTQRVHLKSTDPNVTFLGKTLSFEIDQDVNRKVNIDVVIYDEKGDKFKAFSTSLKGLEEEIKYDE